MAESSSDGFSFLLVLLIVAFVLIILVAIGLTRNRGGSSKGPFPPNGWLTVFSQAVNNKLASSWHNSGGNILTLVNLSYCQDLLENFNLQQVGNVFTITSCSNGNFLTDTGNSLIFSPASTASPTSQQWYLIKVDDVTAASIYSSSVLTTAGVYIIQNVNTKNSIGVSQGTSTIVSKSFNYNDTNQMWVLATPNSACIGNKQCSGLPTNNNNNNNNIANVYNY